MKIMEQTRRKTDINLTALIDVLFLLIILILPLRKNPQ